MKILEVDCESEEEAVQWSVRLRLESPTFPHSSVHFCTNSALIRNYMLTMNSIHLL